MANNTEIDDLVNAAIQAVATRIKGGKVEPEQAMQLALAAKAIAEARAIYDNPVRYATGNSPGGGRG